jgi:hypothetical protein
MAGSVGESWEDALKRVAPTGKPCQASLGIFTTASCLSTRVSGFKHRRNQFWIRFGGVCCLP